MTEFVTDQMQYVDGSRIIRKSTWYDPSTGQSWDTFDDAGDAPAGSASGSVVQSAGQSGAYDPYFSAQTGQEPNANANTPTGGAPATYQTGHGTKAPDSPYASTSTAAPSTSGGSQVPPPTTNTNPNANGPTTVFSGAGAQLSPVDRSRAQNQFLYNEDNPVGAFQNVLRSMGLNPDQGNPLTNILSRAAPGLAAAFNINRANAGPGMQASSDPGGDFASYIRDNLSGGSTFSSLQGAQGGLQSAIDAIQQQNASGAPQAVNPYIERLKQMLGANGGQGLGSIMGALQMPFMSPGVAGAYGQGLQSSINKGLYNYGNDANAFGDTSLNWLNYLYNGGRP